MRTGCPHSETTHARASPWPKVLPSSMCWPPAAPLTAVQLSQQLRYPRPTLYRILDTLCHHDYVMREGEGASYRLSFKVLDLGHQLLERTDLLGAARPVLQRLEAEFRETVHLAVHQDGRMVYLDKCEAPDRSVPIRARAAAFPCTARPSQGRPGVFSRPPRVMPSCARAACRDSPLEPPCRPPPWTASCPRSGAWIRP